VTGIYLDAVSWWHHSSGGRYDRETRCHPPVGGSSCPCWSGRGDDRNRTVLVAHSSLVASWCRYNRGKVRLKPSIAQKQTLKTDKKQLKTVKNGG